MAVDWVASCLREEADLLTGFPFKSEGYTDAIDGVRLLRGDNIVQAALRWDGVKRWPKDGAQEFSNYALAAGDVVLAMDRPWIEAGLKFAAISSADLPCLLVQRTARIRGGETLDTGFLRYLIASRQFTQHVLAVQTGTTVPHISARQILDFEFLLPLLPEQKRIAHILGTLDDKIELNRRMNATLEAMSRAIFKSWFVDFDPVRQKAAGKQPVGMDAQTAALFPDSFEDSEIGEVPKGWGVGRVSDIAEHPRRAARPGEIPAGTPYIGLEHMPRRCVALSDWGEGNGVESNKFEFQRGEILFGKLRPYFHKVGVAPVDGVCSTDIVVARPIRPEWFGVVLGVMSSDEFVAYTNAASTGTKMPRTNWGDMSRYEVVLPPERVAEAFAAFVRAAVDSIAARIHQSRTLAALRDTLLAKLLSGEVRVPEAAEAVKEALG